MDKATALARINEVRATIGTAGWDLLREDIQKQYDDLIQNALRNITDERTLYYAKGAEAVFRQFLKYEEILDSIEANLTEADDASPV